MVIAVMIQVLEELVTGNLFASTNNPGEPLVVQVNGVVHPAFPLKAEGDFGAVDVHMLVLHSGQAIGVVLSRVLRVADADVRRFHQADDGSQHLVPRHAVQAQVAVHTGADAG